MPSPFATELFVKLFGVMPPDLDKNKKKAKVPKTEVLVPNKPSAPGGKIIYHVTPRNKDDRWNIKKEGGSRPSAVCTNKDEAISRAREIAKNQGWSQVIVHNKDGKIAHEFNYGDKPTSKPQASDDDWEPVDETDAGMEMTEVPTNHEKRATTKVDKDAPAQKRTTTRAVWHVTPRAEDGKWRVKRQGSSRPTRVLDKKEDAMNVAREFAKNVKASQVVVHNQDGKISHEHKYDSPATGSESERVTYHVTPRSDDGQWNVIKEGGERPSGIFRTKEEAIERGKELAKNNPKAQILIHNQDGKISYGHKYDDSSEGNSSDRVAYHITPRADDGQWNVTKEGGEKPSGVFKTKEEAIERGKELAKNNPKAQILIHNQDGKISHGHKYGD